MTQATLFDYVEQKRISKQCNKILRRLRASPATNRELCDIACKYTSRISDLREAGYKIECYERDTASGLTWYRLVSK